jgi:hypothetical protein
LLHHRAEGGTGGPHGGKEVRLRGPLDLLVADAEKALQAKPDGTDAADQHVDAVMLVDRALDQPRRAVGCR